MEKAFGYIRTNTAEQKKKSGPSRQLSGIRRCADQMGLEVVKEFQDDISGAVDCIHRPEFQAMLTEMFQDGVKVFIVENLTRLARDNKVQEDILVYLAAKGIHVIDASLCMDVTAEFEDDPYKKALIQIFGIFSELEKNAIVARLQAGRRRTKKLGGRPPVYPKEFKARIHRMYGQGNTYTAIAARLNDEGVKNSKGRKWSPQLVRLVALSGKKKGKRRIRNEV